MFVQTYVALGAFIDLFYFSCCIFVNLSVLRLHLIYCSLSIFCPLHNAQQRKVLKNGMDYKRRVINAHQAKVVNIIKQRARISLLNRVE